MGQLKLYNLVTANANFHCIKKRIDNNGKAPFEVSRTASKIALKSKKLIDKAPKILEEKKNYFFSPQRYRKTRLNHNQFE
ncbi:hypothetical protein GOY07_00700 [Wolbachia endosymbiont of Litomosoides sigmodontis]|uniref:hypothetical protein n=1 Tax=Wolbachia endosymbiont of Litomosoides sigmodontis TaxID=80850 RepID=UPI00158CED4F|nr:hypothetical protein [Wolbachia endosymbiont of Litomosoides sigmodontis]QKX02760.1 hypothetical protein GOY07_00700 [Wolbachia endosymbiont of Litomosoides sigmodontis]